MTIDSNAFVTGSRRYGQPRPDSDLDLVVHMAREEAELMAREFPEAVQTRIEIDRDTFEVKIKPNLRSIVFKFGPLNLIAVWDYAALAAWQEGTEACVNALVSKRRGLTRDEAVAVHTAARKKWLGEPNGDYSNDQ